MYELKLELENVNLFYDMQSRFQNKIALPEKTRAVHRTASVNIFSVAFL
jgi:hypothetical protein